MKTKWGSCNPASARVWFNLELAKKPVQCLEYIVVHEFVHLLDAASQRAVRRADRSSRATVAAVSGDVEEGAAEA